MSEPTNEEMLEDTINRLKWAQRDLEETSAWKMVKELEKEIEYWENLDDCGHDW